MEAGVMVPLGQAILDIAHDVCGFEDCFFGIATFFGKPGDDKVLAADGCVEVGPLGEIIGV